VTRTRFYNERIGLGKVIEGDVEAYFRPRETASAWLLQQALGATITSATATGETTGGGAITHTFPTGNLDDTYKSLTMKMRKGDATNGKMFEYTGVKVNEFKLSAEIDDALKMSLSLIGKDATNTADDVESVLTTTANEALSFVNGRFSVEGTFASLTASSFWHIQSAEITLSNSLKSDNESRRIGSDTLDVLPAGHGNIDITCSIRFDTSTAYDAMIAGTQYSLEFEYLGDTMSGSNIQEGLKLQFPKVHVNNAGDPEIGGPDEVLTSEVTFHVLEDRSSSSGYAMRALLTNDVASY
jgi:hypothetical protein